MATIAKAAADAAVDASEAAADVSADADVNAVGAPPRIAPAKTAHRTRSKKPYLSSRKRLQSRPWPQLPPSSRKRPLLSRKTGLLFRRRRTRRAPAAASGKKR